MEEKWNIEYEKRMIFGFLVLISVIYIKTDFMPLNPVFHHSSTPSFHGIRVRQSQRSLASGDETDRADAEKTVERMCQQLLANTVIENYSFEREGK